jgi:hypothetical protein
MALHYLHRHVPFQEKTVFVMNTLENVTSLRQDGPEAIQELQTDARSVEQIDDQDPGRLGNARQRKTPEGWFACRGFGRASSPTRTAPRDADDL